MQKRRLSTRFQHLIFWFSKHSSCWHKIGRPSLSPSLSSVPEQAEQCCIRLQSRMGVLSSRGFRITLSLDTDTDAGDEDVGKFSKIASSNQVGISESTEAIGLHSSSNQSLYVSHCLPFDANYLGQLVLIAAKVFTGDMGMRRKPSSILVLPRPPTTPRLAWCASIGPYDHQQVLHPVVHALHRHRWRLLKTLLGLG
jgi:hypothetical protein